MLVAPLAEDEASRLAALQQYAVYGTDPELCYDDIVRLASAICGTPIALISLIGESELWFKARLGYSSVSGSRAESICGHAVTHPDELLLIEDTQLDPRFANNPTVQAGGIRFYAAAPLTTDEGHVIGTLCTIHQQPMQMTLPQQQALRALARQVMSNLELSRSNQKLSQQMQLLQQQAEALQQLNNSKDRFFSIIAHDLKAPFQGILGFSELLDTDLEDMSPAEIRNIASYLHDTASSAYKLLENLLNWAMVESGRMTYQPKSLYLETIFDLVEGNLSGAARHKALQLQFICPKDLQVYADENMLRSMLRNLVSNAVKFTPEGGRIQVEARADLYGIEIWVQDNGVGMSPEQLDAVRLSMEISQPNSGAAPASSHTSTNGTRGETGTGLGLALCQQFARRHNSLIQIESTLQQGSRFYFKLPVMAPQSSAKTAEMV
ncbi:MAG: GAF domain-containing sensor histidine kinase [Moraxellaceae bacterium]